ncbi:hypothetical protein CAPTEDRAFT_134943 [Capitella teleta]|uniref:Alkylated DNA repair protein AlkB homologue 8 N-terminal domain-containing protein n=1 Tax=Capitella teleta TaxID=283909 RepID=R7UEI4_CAPTE|nr:hypothetical protein CAPTEDRAFT_134943 [Capitella teleta]|eukprot:ELU04486.1 hypothetical protein CAPTEDRAFT_134943 [Capitella teleta]
MEHVCSFNDLGILIDEKLSFNTHIDRLISKCNRMCGFIIKRSLGFRAPPQVKFRLYKSLCLSILEYCSPLWSPQNAINVKKKKKKKKKKKNRICTAFCH